jgi:hypothetical protein
MRRMLRTVLLKSLLAFALLFAQQGGLMHGIEHTLAEQKQDQSAPQHKHCDLCAVYAQIGSAVGSAAVHFDFSAAFDSAQVSHSASFHSLAFSAFAARAPPYSA